MKRIAVAILVLVAGVALPAYAAEDLGDGNCRQTDGQVGFWNGTTADDEGCITASEYEQMYSATNLKEVGVIDDFVVNNDGSTTLIHSPGIESVVTTNPLDRKVAANPELEPDAPTVRDLFDRIEAALEALAALGLVIE